MPGDTTKELKMKAKPVLVSVVLLAAVCLAGCISKTGTGTGNNYAHRADSAPEGVVVGSARHATANEPASTTK
jgi:predicted small secreted protein